MVKPAFQGEVGFRATGGALVRAVAHGGLKLPPWPALTDIGPAEVGVWVGWLRRVWVIEVVADAISHTSPALAEQVQSLCAAEIPGVRETWRAVWSVVRYLARMVGRPTPNGLFAGVFFSGFARRVDVRWGDGHRVIARAEAGWLAEVIDQLEGCLEVLRRLLVVVNSTVMVRGDRLIAPYQPNIDERGSGAVEVSLRHTAAVRAALDAARAPIRFEDLCTKVQNELPTVVGSTFSFRLIL